MLSVITFFNRGKPRVIEPTGGIKIKFYEL